jgi:hypothetical protein
LEQNQGDRILSAHGIGTLSRYVQQSEIEKHGTSQDKANLPQATKKPHYALQRNQFLLLLEMSGLMEGLG